MKGLCILEGHKAVSINAKFPTANEKEQILRWMEWFRTADRKVAFTPVGPFDLSTVFLGQDPRPAPRFHHELLREIGNRSPLFETWVFVRPPLGGSDPLVRNEDHRYEHRENAAASLPQHLREWVGYVVRTTDWENAVETHRKLVADLQKACLAEPGSGPRRWWTLGPEVAKTKTNETDYMDHLRALLDKGRRR